MKNKLKIMMMVVLSMFIVTGCATTSPTEVVNNYFEEIKKGENAEVTELANDLIKSTEELKATTSKLIEEINQ